MELSSIQILIIIKLFNFCKAINNYYILMHLASMRSGSLLQRPVARACFNDHHPSLHAFLEDARRCLECTRKAPVQFPLCLLLLHRIRIEQELLYFYKIYIYIYITHPHIYTEFISMFVYTHNIH